MENHLKVIFESLEKNINTLMWKCDGCSDVEICEIDNSKNGTSKYCLPLIKAAMMCDYIFKPPGET